MHLLEKVRNMPGQVQEMVLGAVLAIVAMVGLCVVMIRRARAGTVKDVEAWREDKGKNGEKNVVWALTGPPPPSPPPTTLMSSRTW